MIFPFSRDSLCFSNAGKRARHSRATQSMEIEAQRQVSVEGLQLQVGQAVDGQPPFRWNDSDESGGSKFVSNQVLNAKMVSGCRGRVGQRRWSRGLSLQVRVEGGRRLEGVLGQAWRCLSKRQSPRSCSLLSPPTTKHFTTLWVDWSLWGTLGSRWECAVGDP